jgi:hypothetical protein
MSSAWSQRVGRGLPKAQAYIGGNHMAIRGLAVFGLSGALALTAVTAWGEPTNRVPTAVNGYTLDVFANSPAGLTKPDSIAVSEGHIYVGYGGNATDGSDGKSSTIVEYNRSGSVVYSFSVKGHNDGMKVNPCTEQLWVLQNEDANPSLVVFDSKSGIRRVYPFAQAPADGGGYDGIVFRDGRAYLSSSNPHGAINAPAIVEARLERGTVVVRPVLEGDAAATDIVSGLNVALNVQDAGSLTRVPGGDILLDGQAGLELVLVRKPGSKGQSAVVIPLSSPFGIPKADDTLFTPSGDGFMLIVDTGANVIYKLTKAVFAPDVAYTSAVTGAGGLVGRLDLDFGKLTPVVTGLNTPNGLAFVKSVDDERRDHDHRWDHDDKWDGIFKWLDDDRRDDDDRRCDPRSEGR